MNKKTLREIRKHFSEDDDLFTLNTVTTAFIDSEHAVRCVSTKSAYTLSEPEYSCIIKALKKSIRGSIGKNLHEYPFLDPVKDSDPAVTNIRSLVNTKLLDTDAVAEFLSNVAENGMLMSTYAVLIGHCTYTVFHKHKDDTENESDYSDFNFIVTAFCPVELREDGLIYNESDNTIEKKNAYDRIVSQTPTDGFMYPVFTDRSADVNRIIYMTSKSSEINNNLVNQVLHCKCGISYVMQRSIFSEMLDNILDEHLTYSVWLDVANRINALAAEHKHDSSPFVLDASTMKSIMLELNMPQIIIDRVDELFEVYCASDNILVSNLTDKRLAIKAGNADIALSMSNCDTLHTYHKDGRKYILIDVDGAEINVNGQVVDIR